MPAPPHLLSRVLEDKKVAHGFFGRHGGVSSGDYATLNCGPGSRDSADMVAQNRQRCRDTLQAEHLVTLYQTHSATARFIDAPLSDHPEGDALVTNRPGLAIGILTADCMPVLFHDPEAGLIGAAHAGWRGALGGVLESCVRLMTNHDAAPERIRAAIGPCLQQANFEVGFDLIGSFEEKFDSIDRFLVPSKTPDKRQLDLTAFGRWQLEKAGLKPDHIDISPVCTMGAPEDWFSYRHSRKAGLEDYGRNLSAIALSG